MEGRDRPWVCPWLQHQWREGTHGRADKQDFLWIQKCLLCETLLKQRYSHTRREDLKREDCYPKYTMSSWNSTIKKQTTQLKNKPKSLSGARQSAYEDGNQAHKKMSPIPGHREMRSRRAKTHNISITKRCQGHQARGVLLCGWWHCRTFWLLWRVVWQVSNDTELTTASNCDVPKGKGGNV